MIERPVLDRVLGEALRHGGDFAEVFAEDRASSSAVLRLDRGFDQWRSVGPEFHDLGGRLVPRDFAGVAGLHYTNATVRNDLTAFKVARDRRHLYFYARTRAPLTASTDPNWMWLLIDSDQNPHTGWEGYDFIVNRTIENDHTTWLEKNQGGWRWQKVARVSFRVVGNELQLSLPRRALGLADSPQGLSFDFKWADNLQRPGEVMDFYLSGDVSPAARFNYRYVARGP